LNGTESHVELNRELKVVVMLSDCAVSSWADCGVDGTNVLHQVRGEGHGNPFRNGRWDLLLCSI
jgi:hypothetical protein